MQTKTDTYANSVDPDERARYEPSQQDPHCLPFHFGFLTGDDIKSFYFVFLVCFFLFQRKKA